MATEVKSKLILEGNADGAVKAADNTTESMKKVERETLVLSEMLKRANAAMTEHTGVLKSLYQAGLSKAEQQRLINEGYIEEINGHKVLTDKAAQEIEAIEKLNAVRKNNLDLLKNEREINNEHSKLLETGTNVTKEYTEAIKEKIAQLTNEQSVLQKIAELQKQGITVTEQEKQTMINAAKAEQEKTGAKKEGSKVTNEASLSVENYVKSLVTKGLTIAGIIAALKKLYDSMKEIIKVTMEYERAGQALITGLKDYNSELPKALDGMVRLAEETSKKTAIDDEQIKRAEAILLQQGLTADQVQKSLPLIIDFASANEVLGLTLEQAARRFSVSAEGLSALNVSMKQFGINVDSNLTPTEQFNSMLEQIEQKWGGDAERKAAIFEGTVKNLGIAFKNLLQSAGEYITQSETIKNIVNIATIAVDEFSKAIKRQNEYQKIAEASNDSYTKSVVNEIENAKLRGESNTPYIEQLKLYLTLQKELLASTTAIYDVPFQDINSIFDVVSARDYEVIIQEILKVRKDIFAIENSESFKPKSKRIEEEIISIEKMSSEIDYFNAIIADSFEKRSKAEQETIKNRFKAIREEQTNEAKFEIDQYEKRKKTSEDYAKRAEELRWKTMQQAVSQEESLTILQKKHTDARREEEIQAAHDSVKIAIDSINKERQFREQDDKAFIEELEQRTIISKSWADQKHKYAIAIRKKEAEDAKELITSEIQNMQKQVTILDKLINETNKWGKEQERIALQDDQNWADKKEKLDKYAEDVETARQKIADASTPEDLDKANEALKETSEIINGIEGTEFISEDILAAKEELKAQTDILSKAKVDYSEQAKSAFKLLSGIHQNVADDLKNKYTEMFEKTKFEVRISPEWIIDSVELKRSIENAINRALSSNKTPQGN